MAYNYRDRYVFERDKEISDDDEEEEENSEDDDDIESRRQRIREKSKILWEKFTTNLIEVITVKNIINAAFILGVSAMCFHQCYLQILEYLEYKTRIQVTHNLPLSTVYLIPGITICNNNRLRLNKLAEMVPEIEDDIESLLNETSNSLPTEQRKIDLIRTLKAASDRHLNVTKLILESPISKLMNISRSNMIEDINCNTSWGPEINCENIRIIESFQGSPCYTAFFLGSLLESLSNGKAYDYESSLLPKGRRKLTSFESHEIAELVIDFGPLQHGDIHQDVGGKLAIHSTGHIGSIRDVAHTILPGFKYEVILQRYMSKRLPPPYESMCYDYKLVNSPKFTRGEMMDGHIELDKTTCTRNCIIELTTKLCNCWPIEIPYYPGSTFVKNAGQYRMCSWGFDEANMKNFSSKMYVDCYRRFHAECRDKCKPGCRTEDYRVHLVSNPWPGRDKFMMAINDEERYELGRLKACCAIISIKYSDLIERRHIMIPNLTLAQMVSNIGGIVSALVGVSTITIYRYITRRILHCPIASEHVPADLLVPAAPMQASNWPRRAARGPW